MPGSKRLTEERARLVELHVDLARRAVRNIVRKRNLPMWKWPGVEWDDAFSVGYEALCHAAIDWNREVGPFEGFAYHRVWMRVLDWVRIAGPHGKNGTRHIHGNTVSWVYDGGAREYGFSETPTEYLLRDEQLVQDHSDELMGRQFVNYCLGLLSEKQRYVIEETLIKGRTAAAVAKDLGINEMGVYQLKVKAIRRMRKDDEVAYTLL